MSSEKILMTKITKFFAAIEGFIKFANLTYYCTFLHFATKCLEYTKTTRTHQEMR